MKRYILAVIVLALMLGLLFQGLTSFAQEPQGEMAPRLPVQGESLSPSNGFIPPPMDLSHLTGQGMPNSFVSQAPPSSWDWRAQGKVTPVGDQGNCGSCYAFASIGNIEPKMLIDDAGTYDFSENHAKECNWHETADINGGTSCSGGNYFIIANLFSQTGTVLESCDSYVDSDVDCKSTCPYQKTLLDWRIICGNVVPSTGVLKAYIQNYGPVYTAMYVGATTWYGEFASYDGSYTLYYDGPGEPDHAVLIVGWDDTLPHAGGSGGWIVKNSWGTEWGGTCGCGSEKGYFTIAYGSANIGMYSSSIYDWQDYDSNGGIMYYDEGGWWDSWGWGEGYPTAWGLCKFIPSSNTHVSRVEFWTTDVTTDIDVYIYDDFDGTALSNLLAQKLNNSFNEAGYHSVALDSPLAVTTGDDVIAVVQFTNSSSGYPIPIDTANPSHETGRTYYNREGPGHTWWDMGSENGYDVAIRLRTSTLVTPPTVTTVDIRIEGENDTIWSGSVTVTESWITATDSGIEYHLTDPTALGALDEASQAGDFPYETTDEWGSLFVTSIDGEEPEAPAGWMYRVDYFSPMVGAADFILDETTPPDPPHQEVLFALCEWGEPPLKLEVDDTTPDVGDSFTVTVTEYDDDTDEWLPTEGATVYADTSYTTDENGEVEIPIGTNLIVEVYAEKDGYIRSNRVTVTVSPSISLSEGWNLISLPLIPDDSSIDVVLAGISGNVSMVQYYYNNGPEDQGWLWYQPGIAESTLTTMEDGKGYWVNMSSSATLTITGSQMPPELPPTYVVNEGWNLIGFKSTADMDNTDYLTDIAYPVLWGYDPDEGYFNVHPMNEHPDGGDDPTIGDMEVGHGYWLWATSSGTIVP